MALTDYGQINQRTAAWAATEMLSHAEPIIVLGKFGQVKPLPQNKANQVKFRRPVPFTAATTPLTEGVTPTAHTMSYEDVPVTLAQYGDLVTITDVVDDLSEDPVLKDASMLSGEQAAETIEAVTYGVVRAGTNVFYANGTMRSEVDSVITLAAQRKITRNLKNNKSKKITKILSASIKIATRPVEAAYVAVTHTDVEQDIRGMQGFIPTAEYGTEKPLCPEELGRVDDVRYVLSADLDPFIDAGALAVTNGTLSTGGTQSDVYPVMFFGREAFGTVPLKGKEAIKPTVLNPDMVSKSDPLGQRGHVGWKVYFAAVILNQAWMARLEVAATD